MPSVANTIEISKVAGYMMADSVAKNRALENGSVAGRNPVVIYMVRRILESIYLKDANYDGLQVVSDYLYWLCGAWALKAQQVLNLGIGGNVATITLNITGGSLTKRINFIVGQSGALVAAGSRVITITDSNIETGSVEVHADGVELYTPSQADRLSYDVVYTTNSIVITLNGDATADQAFRITYDKQTAAGSGSGGGSVSVPEPIYYVADGTEGNTLEMTELFGLSLGLVFRSSVPQQPVASPPTLVGTYSFDNNTLDGATPTGTITWAFPLALDELIIINPL